MVGLAANIMRMSCNRQNVCIYCRSSGAGEAFHVDQTTDNHLKSECKTATNILDDIGKWLVSKMFTLGEKSRENIYETTGMTVEQIMNSDFEEIDAKIGEKVGHKISGYIKNGSLISCGSVYAETGRFLYIDQVDKELGKHDRRKSKFVRKTISAI